MEFPQYTRPRSFRCRTVPDILLSAPYAFAAEGYLTGKAYLLSGADLTSGNVGAVASREGVGVVFEGEAGDSALPMGIALYKRPADGAIFAIVSRKTGPSGSYLWQYRLSDDGDGHVTGTKVREFGTFSDATSMDDGVPELGEIEAALVEHPAVRAAATARTSSTTRRSPSSRARARPRPASSSATCRSATTAPPASSNAWRSRASSARPTASAAAPAR